MTCLALKIGGVENRREKPETMKKAPKTGAFGLEPVCLPLFRARPSYFFFLAGAFFFGAAFLVALFID
jgi:hypothetical protein